MSKAEGMMKTDRERIWKNLEWKFLTGCVLSLAVFGAVIGLFLGIMDSFSRRVEAENAETLQKAIQRACVQCYAIEGRYPPSVKYLEQEYGIRIDEERYDVFYSGFASNVMPDITVVPVKEVEKQVSGRQR